MSEETKAKIAATRAAKAAANGGETVKRATLEEQVAAAQAMADSGDETARSLMPVVDQLKAAMSDAKTVYKAAARRLRKSLSILK